MWSSAKVIEITLTSPRGIGDQKKNNIARRLGKEVSRRAMVCAIVLDTIENRRLPIFNGQFSSHAASG
jgi:hypothetical protein